MALKQKSLRLTCVSLYTPRRHAGAVKIQLRPFLTLALSGEEWPVLCLEHFAPRKEPQHVLYCCTIYYIF
jgi:hypothetical protein